VPAVVEFIGLDGLLNLIGWQPDSTRQPTWTVILSVSSCWHLHPARRLNPPRQFITPCTADLAS